MIDELLHRIKRRWIKLRLQPIRVFCLHHVCETYDESTMYLADWMQIDDFKAKVQKLRQDGVEFISLTEANRHICSDWLRRNKYAVLTFDDGYASLKEILPWLEERQIPVTLFINGKYLDGKSYRKIPKEKYLTKEEIDQLSKQYPLLTIGSHGWEHNRVTDMTDEEFAESVTRNISLLRGRPNYIPYWAYTYGVHTEKTDAYLRSIGIVPVYIDGAHNYNEIEMIHRELL